MKLGVMNPVLYTMPLSEALRYLSGLGVQAIEMGSGGYPGKAHFDPAEYLASPAKVSELKSLLERYGIEIAAFACHGNAVHPNTDIARRFHNDFADTLKVAELFEVDRIVTFSGCPGGCPAATTPNWVTYTRPAEWAAILDYQWNDVLLPYWTQAAEMARHHGIDKIALEMHPNHCVYNPETLLRLRDAIGGTIGANFDPSHLIWQGIEPTAAIAHLGEQRAIYHFHAKDLRFYEEIRKINGVLDTKDHAVLTERSWLFCTVGDGNDYQIWKQMLDALVAVGYDGVISIEHSDALLPPFVGLERAIAFLKQILDSKGMGADTNYTSTS